VVKHEKDGNIFLECLGEVTPLVLKNNSRLQIRKIKGIETRKKVSYSYKGCSLKGGLSRLKFLQGCRKLLPKAFYNAEN